MNASAAVAQSKGRGLAVALLVAGLIAGLGIGYAVVPRGQTPSAPANTITMTGSVIHLSVLAGPVPDMFSFVIGGLRNPTLQVPVGAEVVVHFSNIDPALPHSFGVVGGSPPFAAEPPETAFEGAETPNAHMGSMPGENATFSFTASTAGTYWYVCHVPGHATGGMFGKFEVRA